MTEIHDPNDSTLFVFTEDGVDKYSSSEWDDFRGTEQFLFVEKTIKDVNYIIAIYPMSRIKKVLRV